MKSCYSVIGAMAGSSMDGLDLAAVEFQLNKRWFFTIQKIETIPYPLALHKKLKSSPNLTKKEQDVLDQTFGEWVGEQIIAFGKELSSTDLVGVHGHTVIHQPDKGISWQLGSGKAIARTCQLPTVTDFRSQDIVLGGQGAPLVPLGDFLLFSDYDACLNLGGIANISLKYNQSAWDISPCNQVLNYFANTCGIPYDKDGEMARKGKLITEFYDSLCELPYFSLPPPKSLPNNFIPEKTLDKINPRDGLHTYSLFIADQVKQALSDKKGNLLITGGGAHNSFLVGQIKERLSSWQVVVPDAQIVDFKEALVFAFLALKKLLKETNTLASVTGASKDSSSGVIHLP